MSRGASAPETVKHFCRLRAETFNNHQRTEMDISCSPCQNIHRNASKLNIRKLSKSKIAKPQNLKKLRSWPGDLYISLWQTTKDISSDEDLHSLSLIANQWLVRTDRGSVRYSFESSSPLSSAFLPPPQAPALWCPGLQDLKNSLVLFVLTLAHRCSVFLCYLGWSIQKSKYE